MKAFVLAALPVFFGSFLIECDGKDPGEGEDGTDPGEDGTDPGEDGTDPGGDDTGFTDVSATIRGTVNVQLYTVDENGDKVEASYDDVYGEGAAFPFGKIFVTAYYEDEDGVMRYVADQVIDAPSPEGNEYELNVEMAGEHEVFVYAVLDYYPVDSIVGTQEPKGVHPRGLEIADGDVEEDVDISILAAPYSSGGGGCDTIDISGEVTLTTSYAGGDVAVMLLSDKGDGPYFSISGIEPENDGGGASADYSLYSCTNYGAMQLKGAWDKNGNGMFDPRDKWGAYISDPDVNGNPITVGSVDLVGYEIQIPLGGEEGLKLVPFVRLSGSVNAGITPLSDLTGPVYVAALKYRPNGDVAVSALEEGYDLDTFEKASGDTLEWQLIVPADTIVYLWAYNDGDSDGVVNEAGEYVGSGNGGDGKYPTGTESQSGIIVSLGKPAGG